GIFLPTSVYSNGLTSARFGVISGTGKAASACSFPSRGADGKIGLAGSCAASGSSDSPRKRAATRRRVIRHILRRVRNRVNGRGPAGPAGPLPFVPGGQL